MCESVRFYDGAGRVGVLSFSLVGSARLREPLTGRGRVHSWLRKFFYVIVEIGRSAHCFGVQFGFSFTAKVHSPQNLFCMEAQSGEFKTSVLMPSGWGFGRVSRFWDGLD